MPNRQTDVLTTMVLYIGYIFQTNILIMAEASLTKIDSKPNNFSISRRPVIQRNQYKLVSRQDLQGLASKLCNEIKHNLVYRYQFNISQIVTKPIKIHFQKLPKMVPRVELHPLLAYLSKQAEYVLSGSLAGQCRMALCTRRA